MANGSFEDVTVTGSRLNLAGGDPSYAWITAGKDEASLTPALGFDLPNKRVVIGPEWALVLPSPNNVTGSRLNLVGGDPSYAWITAGKDEASLTPALGFDLPDKRVLTGPDWTLTTASPNVTGSLNLFGGGPYPYWICAGKDPQGLSPALGFDANDPEKKTITAGPGWTFSTEGDIKVGGDVILTGADCAEDFDALDPEQIEAGTVMVIGQDGVLEESQTPHDTRVAGVVSGAGDFRPAIRLDRRLGEAGRVPIALSGKVFCKVDAAFGPIEVGDLLTSSHTRGHAMKVAEPAKAVGAILGKALRPLRQGRGLVPILVTHQ
jgi:hypothetical protein